MTSRRLWRDSCKRFFARCLSGGLLPFAMLAHPLLADNFYTVPPCRVLDTRTTNTPIQTNTPTTFGVGGMCGVPLEASAVVSNTTLVPQGTLLDLAVFPGDLTTPTTSNVVSVGQNPNAPIAGFAVLPLSNDGQGSVGVLASSALSGSTDLIFDVAGYFMADSFTPGWPGPSDYDPGVSDNLNVTYTDSLGQQSDGTSSAPTATVPGQGGAGSHYFVSSAGRPVPLVGVSADNACHMNKTAPGQCNISNYQQIISDAAGYGLNVIRLWVDIGGQPNSGCVYDAVNSDPNDQPFEYDGSSTLADNLGRWHLDTKNPGYFQRLQNVVAYAASLNMYVEVTIFSPQTPYLALSPWYPGHAYLKNGTPLTGFTDPAQFVNAASAQYLAMKTYVFNVADWTVDYLYSYPNVYYEVANEPEWINPPRQPLCNGWNTQSTTSAATVAAWQNAIANELKAHMATKGVSQQVAVEASTFTDADQFRSGKRPGGPTGAGPFTAEASIINSHYTRMNPATSTGIRDGLGAIRLGRAYYSQAKILGFNETKIVAGGCNLSPNSMEGVAEGRAEAWEFMVNQGGVYNQFGYACPIPTCPPPSTPSTAYYCETRRQMGALRSFLAGPVNIGRNLITSTSGVGPNAPPDWINVLPYPEPPPTGINKFWAAVEPTATAAARRWLLYIHRSKDRGLVQDGYRQVPNQPPFHETGLSVCLGAASGTYTAYWINPAFPVQNGAVNPIVVNGAPATQTINWTGMTGCVPGGAGSVALNTSPAYAYDIALFISQ